MSQEIISKSPPIGVIGPSIDKLIPISSCKDNKYIENEKNTIPISMNFPIRAWWPTCTTCLSGNARVLS